MFAHRFPLIVLGIAAMLPMACAMRGPAPFRGSKAAGGVAYPFAPASMQIHPLSRVDRDASNTLWILCHVEFKDAWGDTCKGAGELQIQLYRPLGARASGLGEQELAWDIDLSDLDRNASLYDPATRTYRLPLEGAPEWIAGVIASGPDAPRVRLRAAFTGTSPIGEPLFLQHEYTIGE